MIRTCSVTDWGSQCGVSVTNWWWRCWWSLVPCRSLNFPILRHEEGKTQGKEDDILGLATYWPGFTVWWHILRAGWQCGDAERLSGDVQLRRLQLGSLRSTNDFTVDLRLPRHSRLHDSNIIPRRRRVTFNDNKHYYYFMTYFVCHHSVGGVTTVHIVSHSSQAWRLKPVWRLCITRTSNAERRPYFTVDLLEWKAVESATVKCEMPKLGHIST